jgi:sulfur carrier protein ThiS
MSSNKRKKRTLGRRFELLRCCHQRFSRPPPWTELGYPSNDVRRNGQKVNLRVFYMSIGPMKVKIICVPQDTSTEMEIKKGETVKMVLKRLHLRTDAVIVVRGTTPIPMDDILEDEQELRILQVASGG